MDDSPSKILADCQIAQIVDSLKALSSTQNPPVTLVALDTSVRLPILAQTIVLSGLVVLTGGAAARTSGSATALPTLGTSLVGIDLALSELY